MRPVALAVAATVLLAAPARAQLTVSGAVGVLDRRLSESGTIERQDGLVGGAGVALTRGPMGLAVAFVGGKLMAKTGNTPDADYGRIAAAVTVRTTPWLVFEAGVSASVFASPLGSQRWILPRVGVSIEVPLASVPARLHFAAAAIVGASTNGQAAASGGLAARAGVVGGRGTVCFLAEYELERLTFSNAGLQGGAGREEQRGEVRAGLVVRL